MQVCKTLECIIYLLIRSSATPRRQEERGEDKEPSRERIPTRPHRSESFPLSPQWQSASELSRAPELQSSYRPDVQIPPLKRSLKERCRRNKGGGGHWPAGGLDVQDFSRSLSAAVVACSRLVLWRVNLINHGRRGSW